MTEEEFQKWKRKALKSYKPNKKSKTIIRKSDERVPEIDIDIETPDIHDKKKSHSLAKTQMIDGQSHPEINMRQGTGNSSVQDEDY